MRILAALFVFLCIAVNAQKNQRVEFQNLHFISPKFALNFLDTTTHISSDKINQAIRDYYALGYYNDIWVSKEDINTEEVFTFYFVPRNTVKKIEASGYFKDGNKDEILPLFTLNRTSTYTPKDIETTQENINQFLQDQGLYESQFYVTEDITNFNADINIEVNKGRDIFIKRISILGNENINTTTIKKKMIIKERDMLHYIPILFNNGKLNSKLAEFNPSILRDLYLENGFFDVQILTHQIVIDFKTYEATLFIEVQEGKQYTIDQVTVQILDNHSQDINTQNIQDLLTLKKGEVFNINDLRRDYPTLQTKIADKGYANAQIIPDFAKNDNQIDVIFKIILGNIITINDVIIEGNYKTQDRTIRREMYLAPGDTYSQSDFTDSLLALRRSGFFASVEIEQKILDAHTIDLIVHIEENKNTQFTLGGGASESEGFLLSGSIKEVNTFGSGILNTLDASWSQKETKFNYSIKNPRLFNSLYNTTFSIYNTTSQYTFYNKKAKGFSLLAGKKLTRNLSFNAGIGYDNSDINDTSEANNTRQTQAYTKNNLNTNLNYDSTNNFLFPSKGYRHRLNLAYNGLTGDLQFAKVNAKSALYRSLRILPKKEIIFSAQAGFSSLISTGSEIPFHERLYLGGSGNVRAFEPFSIYPTTTEVKGGEQLAFASLEASIPLYQNTIRLLVFGDYGMIGNDAFNDVTRGSYGYAIQIITPIMPFVFSFPYAIGAQEGDKVRDFYFDIGSIF